MGAGSGLRRIGKRALDMSLRRFGLLSIAERFAAPEELAAIGLPPPPLAREGGPVRFLLIDPIAGSFRSVRLERVRPGAAFSFAFSAFANRAGAYFLLFVFQPAAAGPVTPRRWQIRLAALALGTRPPVLLPCNEALPSFHALALPPQPAQAMHLIGAEAIGKEAEIPVAGAIESCWQEGGGCYVQGWLHAYERRVEAASVLGGRAPRPIAHLAPRPDLLANYPMLPEPSPAAGFSLFVPFHSGETMTFLIETEAGPTPLALPLPASPAAAPDVLAHEAALRDQGFVRFVAEANARRLEVLEIGARLVGSRSEAQRERFPKARRYVGMDVHPGPLVDVVGDAHELSRVVGRASFDAVFSGAVLEHLAMPWLVAAEINRALRLGGITYHITPQAWPVHEEPNDFWRFTDEALKVLFGAPFGFEVLQAGMADRIRLYPLEKDKGDLSLPFGYGYGSAWVLARKVAEIDEARAMPASLGVLGRRYPRPG